MGSRSRSRPITRASRLDAVQDVVGSAAFIVFYLDAMGVVLESRKLGVERLEAQQEVADGPRLRAEALARHEQRNARRIRDDLHREDAPLELGCGHWLHLTVHQPRIGIAGSQYGLGKGLERCVEASQDAVLANRVVHLACEIAQPHPAVSLRMGGDELG